MNEKKKRTRSRGGSFQSADIHSGLKGAKFVSVTCLRIRSIRFLPQFALHTLRSLRQVRRAPGFLDGSILADRRWTFWTLTAWDQQESMRQYMINGPHRAAMPHLLHWCDEASVVHWDQEDVSLPGWEVADRRMRAQGRISKVRFPSPQHAAMNYDQPRLTSAGPIRSKKVQGSGPPPSAS